MFLLSRDLVDISSVPSDKFQRGARPRSKAKNKSSQKMVVYLDEPARFEEPPGLQHLIDPKQNT